MSIGLVPLSI